jgi:hypothetical protein
VLSLARVSFCGSIGFDLGPTTAECLLRPPNAVSSKAQGAKTKPSHLGQTAETYVAISGTGTSAPLNGGGGKLTKWDSYAPLRRWLVIGRFIRRHPHRRGDGNGPAGPIKSTCDMIAARSSVLAGRTKTVRRGRLQLLLHWQTGWLIVTVSNISIHRC